MRIGVDTNGYVPSQRLRRWRELMCETYMRMDCQTDHEEFRYVVDGYRIGDYSLIRETSAGHDATRRHEHASNDGIERFYVAFLLRGRSFVRQGRREAMLQPGPVAFHDTTRPFVTRMGPSNDVLWLGIPKQPFVERFRGTEDLTTVAFKPSQHIVRHAFALWSQMEAFSIHASPADKVNGAAAEVLDLLASLTMLNALAASGRGSARLHHSRHAVGRQRRTAPQDFWGRPAGEPTT